MAPRQPWAAWDDICRKMSEAERPSGSQRSMYAELPYPLCNCKCISGETRPWNYEERGPTEHLRRDYHHCRSYPIELQQGPFDRSVDFRAHDDHRQPGYYYHPGIGICMCNDPASRLNAYARDRPYGDYTRGLPALPGRPWPQWDAWISPHRRGRGKFCSWYHSAQEGPAGGPASGEDPQGAGRGGYVPSGADMTHRELLHVQRPTGAVDVGYRSRWGFHQP